MNDNTTNATQKTFSVKIITQEKVMYNADAISLIVPAALGYMGILVDHAPVIACLNKGKIILRDSKQNINTFFCDSKGVVEMFNNNATIILYQADKR